MEEGLQQRDYKTLGEVALEILGLRFEIPFLGVVSRKEMQRKIIVFLKNQFNSLISRWLPGGEKLFYLT